MKSFIQKFQSAILVLGLILIGQQFASAQINCRVQIIKTQNPGINPYSVTFSAIPADSISLPCFNAGTSYTWTFGDNSQGTGQTVSHTYNGPGYYGVCVVAQSTFGNQIVECDTLDLDSISPTNCNISFSIQPGIPAIPLTYQFDPVLITPQCFPPGTVYTWTWGNGTSTVTQSPQPQIKTYTSPGTYTVCLKAAPQQYPAVTYCQTLQVVTPTPVSSIFGQVYANGNCIPGSLRVELVSLSDSLQPTILTSGGPDSCFYWFQVPSLPARNWVVRATPLETNDFLPTYLGDVIYYNDATVFTTPASGQSLNLPVINLVPNIWGDSLDPDSSINPSWGRVSGTISGNGTLISSLLGTNNMNVVFNVSRATIIILNSQNQPVGFVFVNADGTYTTPGLPPGQYSLKVEYPKAPSVAVPFTITAGSQGTVNFAASGSGINTVTSVNRNLKAEAMVVYPNPASNKISLSGVKGAVKIIDAKGKVVLETSETSNIGIAKLPSGLYTITGIGNSNRVVTARFMKN